MVDTSDEWIRSRTGIERRHVASEGETTTDLAEHAARRAMADAQVSAADIDLICVGTTTPDLVFPNVGTLLQERLGIHNGCPAFSLEAACTGFMYALSVADKFVRLGESKCALVVGAETLTRIVDWKDRGTCVLFADGAGAVVLTPSAEPGIISTRLHSDGRYKDLLMYPDGVSKGFKLVREGKAGVQMKGNEVYKVAVNTLGQLVTETLNANNIAKDQLDWLIPHQANIRIIEAIAKRLELADGARHRDDRRSGQYLGRVGAAGARYGHSGRPRAAWATAPAGGLRGRIYLGVGAYSLLMGGASNQMRTTRWFWIIGMLASAARAEVFPLAAEQDSIGELGQTEAEQQDTLPDVARQYHLGFDEIIAANPGVDTWLPGAGYRDSAADAAPAARRSAYRYRDQFA